MSDSNYADKSFDRFWHWGKDGDFNSREEEEDWVSTVQELEDGDAEALLVFVLGHNGNPPPPSLHSRHTKSLPSLLPWLRRLPDAAPPSRSHLS